MIPLNEKEVKIAILIPSYNSEHRIRECLLSIINQSNRNFALYLSDDGSTDSTMDIVESMRQSLPMLKLYKNLANLGTQANFANLLNICEEPYFFFLDSEDSLSEDYISNFYSLLNNSGDQLSMIIPRFSELDNQGGVRNLEISNRLKSMPGRHRFLSALLSSSLEGVGHPIYSIFNLSLTKPMWERVLKTTTKGSWDISASLYFLFCIERVGFIDSTLWHFSEHYTINDARRLLNNYYLFEQYAHTSPVVMQDALADLFMIADENPDFTEKIASLVSLLVSSKYDSIRSLQSLRDCLGLQPLLGN